MKGLKDMSSLFELPPNLHSGEACLGAQIFDATRASAK